MTPQLVPSSTRPVLISWPSYKLCLTHHNAAPTTGDVIILDDNDEDNDMYQLTQQGGKNRIYAYFDDLDLLGFNFYTLRKRRYSDLEQMQSMMQLMVSILLFQIHHEFHYK